MAAKKKKPALTPGRIQRLVQNPGTRSKLPDRFLSPEQRQQRALNTRLNAPITAGSTMTNRELARQRKNAIALRYGATDVQQAGDVATAQQVARDVPNWYDAYQASLRQHQANVGQINQQSSAAMQGLTGSIQGLGQGSQNVVNQAQQAQQAVTGGVASPQNAVDASNASALRQALLASFGAQMAQTGGANQTYADTLANVVAPGQKLQAQAQTLGGVNKARQAQATTAAEKGAYGAQYETTARTDEAKNILAQQIATGKTAAALEIAKVGAKTKTSVAKTQAAARRSAAKTSAQTQADKVITSGAFQGLTNAQVRAMTPAQKAQAKKEFQRTGKTAKATTGPGSITPAAEQKYVTQINKVLSWLQTPPSWPSGPSQGRPMTAADVYNSLKRGGVLAGGSPIDPRILDVARSLYHNKGTGLGQFGVSKAHDLGIRVQGRWKVVK